MLPFRGSLGLWFGVLFEVATSNLLFPVPSGDNDREEDFALLLQIEATLGKIQCRQVVQGKYFNVYFKSRGHLLNEQAHKEIKKKVGTNENIFTRLSTERPLNSADAINFEELLRKLMAFDPEKRISASQALRHEFFK
jgi:serine/threonine protein kinase